MDSYSELVQQQSIKQRLRSRNNGFVPVKLAGNETIPTMFDRQVQDHAGKAAVVSAAGQITYQELARASCGIAAHLRELMDDMSLPVALLVADHINFVATSLGILRCGGFYVPLDATFPEDRNARILLESKAGYLLTEKKNRELAERLAHGRKLLYVEELSGRADPFQDCSSPDGLACLIFTSGSTGQPKGVMQTHRNIMEIVTRYTHGLFLGCEDRVGLFSSFSVTASIGTIFGSLLNGATLCPFSVKEEGLQKLADCLDSERITVYRSVPSLFRHLMDSVDPQRIFRSVQIVRLGGDSLYRRDWELYKQHFSPESALINFYGCSEMSTVARFYMDAASRLGDGVLPVGFPLDHVRIFVVDDMGAEHCVNEDDARMDSFVTGEIVLRSRHLAPGYWNDAGGTAAVFQGASDEKTYRTGDLGTWRGEQGLVHVGRADLQVKVSGFRVEIAEVEACLRSFPEVKETAVLLHSPEHGERELIGFVVMASGATCRGSEVRAHAQERMPVHMVPSEVMAIERMPLTPNGKIDRAALIGLRKQAWRAKAKSLPRTPTEEVLSEVWRQVLNVPEVGMEDNFFELGGNSLLGMKLAARTMEKFAVPLRVLTVFQHPTIAELGQLIDVLSRRVSSDSPNAELMDEGAV